MVSILHAYFLFRHEILKNLPIVSPTISRNTLEVSKHSVYVCILLFLLFDLTNVTKFFAVDS